MTRKNFAREIRTCIKRYYIGINNIKNWLDSGGVGDIKNLITLEGDNNMPKHPILNFSYREKQVFIQCFGEPILSPKDFAHVSAIDYIKRMEKRRDFMRYTIGMTNNSRYIGLYSPKPNKRRVRRR